MSNMLTVRLDPDLEHLLDKLCRSSGAKRSDVVREALRRHLSLRSFERLRERMVPLARKKGYITDEDVFRKVS
ncbi:MAG: CopG family transcriptional regulator [Chthoniobacterales bacterium]|nr:CopG family transcriptional regulator [Chthoniobacterales bacterium]